MPLAPRFLLPHVPKPLHPTTVAPQLSESHTCSLRPGCEHLCSPPAEPQTPQHEWQRQLRLVSVLVGGVKQSPAASVVVEPPDSFA